MWIIDGPFDGPVNNSSFTKSKLLKPGKRYTIGRKATTDADDLVINCKVVSQGLCEFHIALESVTPNGVPSLIFKYHKERICQVVNPGMEERRFHPHVDNEAQSGDNIKITNAIAITLRWHTVDIFAFSPKIKKDTVASLATRAALLGASVSRTHSPHTTHFLLPAIPPPPYANRLISGLLSGAQLVTPGWVERLIELGDLPRGATDGKQALEDIFQLPDENRYRPEGDGVENWAPNARRTTLFSGIRFCLLTEGVAPKEFLELIDGAGGSFTSFDVKSAASGTWKDKLPKLAARNKNLVPLVLDEDSASELLAERWEIDYVEVTKSLNMRIATSGDFANALIKCDTSFLYHQSPHPAESRASSSSDASHQAAASNEEDVAMAPPPVEKVVVEKTRSLPPRRSARAASKPPEEQGSTQADGKSKGNGKDESKATGEMRPPRRALTRRVDTAPTLNDRLGLEPPSVADVEPKDLPPPTQSLPRASRLKRRANTVAPEDEVFPATQRPAATQFTQVSEEPPHKRFKALFDETADDSGGQSGSNGKTIETRSSSATSVAIVERSLSGKNGRDEDDDEVEVVDAPQSQAKKRALVSRARTASAAPTAELDKAPSHSRFKALFDGTKESAENDPIADEQDAERPDTAPQPPPETSAAGSSKPLSARVNRAPSATVSEHSSKSKSRGALPNQPDTDSKLQQALASKKPRGKKVDDAFDREFNQLRISALEQRQNEEADVWGAFEKDMDIRGNFMVIQIADLMRKDGGRRNHHVPETTDTGIPNFKKFKKKITEPRGAKVELVLNDGKDYGVGASYWPKKTARGSNEGSPAPSQSRASAPPRSRSVSKQPPNPKKRASSREYSDSEVEDIILPPAKRQKGKTPLPRVQEEMDDGEGDERTEVFNMDVSGSDDQASVARSSVAPSRKGRAASVATSRKGSVPPATRASGTSRKKKAPVVVADQDSDEEVFAGFGRRRR
ncbi:hypothetical protein BOTBODRAFT_35379 [Botryobasidium botryosum FD-172 SS1]|uniref:BRCT domain-containing protein n=1 Tax=Botryobasidium botryosum (strain FD-172 SS1) TaxID=930990 RepID=A0A067MHY6_BOTB1|nr:hypothetical protein BOTBODRAFT_35379 [Botryobasidium botryosum FD-172 SS1]